MTSKNSENISSLTLVIQFYPGILKGLLKKNTSNTLPLIGTSTELNIEGIWELPALVKLNTLLCLLQDFRGLDKYTSYEFPSEKHSTKHLSLKLSWP